MCQRDRGVANRRCVVTATTVPDLTDMEVAVLILAADGCPNREIAATLHVGYGTVEYALKTAAIKLDSNGNRANVVLRALQERVIP